MGIDLVLTSVGGGRYRAHYGERVICTSRQPLLAASRVFVREGYPGETRISMRHAGSRHEALSSTIGYAGGFTVRETDTEGPFLVKLSPQEGQAALHGQPPSGFNGVPAPGQPPAAKNASTGLPRGDAA